MVFAWLLAASTTAPMPATSPWVVLNRGHQCTIARSFRGPDGDVTAQIGMAPGIEQATLLLTVPAFKLSALPNKVTVKLGASIDQMQIGWYAVDDPKFSVGQAKVARTTLDELSRSATLGIDLDKRSYLLATGTAPKAVAAFRDCLDTLLLSWGGSPAVQNASSPPQWTNLRHVLKDLRFPYRGSAAELDGRTRVRLSLDERGDVTSCEPLLQIGVADYLIAACKTLRRLRASPARLDGRPVPFITTQTIAWSIN